MFSFYAELQKADAERRVIVGIASTAARDSQGEIILPSAMEAALPGFLVFPALREMHQPSAVGTVTKAAVVNSELRIEAKVVDDDAWEKVQGGVYRGLSIGGSVTARDPADRSIITGIDLVEISLVDRPANPEAVIEAFKAAASPYLEIADRPGLSAAQRARILKVGGIVSRGNTAEIEAHRGELETALTEIQALQAAERASASFAAAFKHGARFGGGR